VQLSVWTFCIKKLSLKWTTGNKQSKKVIFGPLNPSFNTKSVSKTLQTLADYKYECIWVLFWKKREKNLNWWSYEWKLMDITIWPFFKHKILGVFPLSAYSKKWTSCMKIRKSRKARKIIR
jgi:hypothetical protein